MISRLFLHPSITSIFSKDKSGQESKFLQPVVVPQ
jgi:hypothetical protein